MTSHSLSKEFREVQLHALVDGKKVIITEVTVRRDLQLEDKEGVDCLPNSTIFEQLTPMGYEKISQKLTFYKAFFSPQWKFLIHTVLQCLSSKTTAWNEFSSTMASAIIYLATNQKFNFSKYIFESMVPQPSGHIEHVADEAVHKELGDSLVRAATTASSLEAEHDSGNITKTRSKATPNESSSLGTTSGGGPRRQETIGDTIAQTRFENVSKLSNDSLLTRGNTLRSDDDRLKLKELMELCTNLQQKVLDLEKTKTTQANEIVSLKGRVKKLEHKKRSRTHGLKRLYKVGLTARVESSEDLSKDASKQGRRINAIDADEYITLVNVQDDADNEMFDVNTLDGEEVFVAGQNENVVEEIVDAAQVSTTATTVTITTEEITLAQALAKLKSTKPKAKGIAFKEPGGSTTTIISSKVLSQDKGKGILVEPEMPLKKKDQLKLDEEIARKLQAEIDEEERIARAKEEKINEANIVWDDIQAKQRRKHFAAKRAEEKRNKPPTKTLQKKIMITYVKNMEGWKHKDLKSKDFNSIKELFDKAFIRKVDEDKDTTELQSLMEVIPDEEEVAIDVVPLATKSPSIIDWKIHKEGKKSYYQIVRANGKSQMYRVFSQMLKSFTREDLEDLYKLVKAKYGSTRPVEDLDLVLWNDLETILQSGMIYMLIEKRYPLTPPTITDMLNKKLQGMIVRIKSLLNAASITAALIDVNAAQSKLVLLENFNENYSK
ncbi:hypothetical protein Tco_1405027 [Tanacetum coccineum]